MLADKQQTKEFLDILLSWIRDTLLSSIAMSKMVMAKLGMADSVVENLTETFMESDERLLLEQHAIHDSEEELIQSSQETVRELELLFKGDSEE